MRLLLLRHNLLKNEGFASSIEFRNIGLVVEVAPVVTIGNTLVRRASVRYKLVQRVGLHLLRKLDGQA